MRYYNARGFSLTKLILQFLADAGEATVAGFVSEKHPKSRFARRLLNGRPRPKRESVCALLSRLRSQGLVSRSGTMGASRWKLTDRGRKLIEETDTNARDGIGRIVIFDIPEDERKKRDAIRGELVAAGFIQLQKSVWFGERPLPESFVEFLKLVRAEHYVHIFSVRERGTIPSETKAP